jgi:hypothetical protein
MRKMGGNEYKCVRCVKCVKCVKYAKMREGQIIETESLARCKRVRSNHSPKHWRRHRCHFFPDLSVPAHSMVMAGFSAVISAVLVIQVECTSLEQLIPNKHTLAITCASSFANHQK